MLKLHSPISKLLITGENWICTSTSFWCDHLCDPRSTGISSQITCDSVQSQTSLTSQPSSMTDGQSGQRVDFIQMIAELICIIHSIWQIGWNNINYHNLGHGFTLCLLSPGIPQIIKTIIQNIQISKHFSLYIFLQSTLLLAIHLAGVSYKYGKGFVASISDVISWETIWNIDTQIELSDWVS